MYLQDFTHKFEIGESVRFEIEVVHVRLEKEKWKIKSRKRGKYDNEKGFELDEIFDTAVVCNRHYTKPRVIDILGISSWYKSKRGAHCSVVCISIIYTSSSIPHVFLSVL